MQYKVSVNEVRVYSRTYIVEANSKQEATWKAEVGETIDETEGSLREVIERVVTAKPQEIN